MSLSWWNDVVLRRFNERLATSSAMSSATAILALFGLATVSWPFLKLGAIGLSLSWPGIPLSKFGAGKGAWAAITGSTGPIGAAMAEQLAQKGFNIILISRNPSKLKEQAKAIKASSEVEVEWLAIDLEHASEADWVKLATFVDGFTIGLLFNNAGVSEDIPGDFIELPIEESLTIASVNVAATVRITRMVAPKMAQRRRGLIIQGSSFVGSCPAPGVAVYCGTKAFLHHFSASLGYELAKHNVKVISLNTHAVSSPTQNGELEPSLFVAKPGPYVKSVLSRLGNRGGAIGLPPTIADLHPGHAFEAWFSLLLPWSSLMDAIGGMYIQIAERKRAIKSKA